MIAAAARGGWKWSGGVGGGRRGVSRLRNRADERQLASVRSVESTIKIVIFEI